MLKELNEMYARYLKMAVDDITAYTNEQDIWKVAPELIIVPEILHCI